MPNGEWEAQLAALQAAHMGQVSVPGREGWYAYPEDVGLFALGAEGAELEAARAGMAPVPGREGWYAYPEDVGLFALAAPPAEPPPARGWWPPRVEMPLAQPPKAPPRPGPPLDLSWWERMWWTPGKPRPLPFVPYGARPTWEELEVPAGWAVPGAPTPPVEDVLTIKTHMKGNVALWVEQYKDEPEIDISWLVVDREVWAKRDLTAKQIDDLQIQNEDALRARAYGSQVFDPTTGEMLSWDEVVKLARIDPAKAIVEVLALGKGKAAGLETTVNDLIRSYGPGGLARKAKEHREKAVFGVEEQLWREESARLAREHEAYLARKEEILQGDMDYDAKVSALLALYGIPEWERGSQRRQQAVIEVEDAMSAEWRAGRGFAVPGMSEAERLRLASKAPPKPEAPPPTTWKAPIPAPARAPVNIAALKRGIEPYGISVLPNYPYLSPMTEEHLRRLPPDVLDMMSQYLSEMGLGWREFLAISAELYEPRPTVRGKFAIPSQWR